MKRKLEQPFDMTLQSRFSTLDSYLRQDMNSGPEYLEMWIQETKGYFATLLTRMNLMTKSKCQVISPTHALARVRLNDTDEKRFDKIWRSRVGLSKSDRKFFKNKLIEKIWDCTLTDLFVNQISDLEVAHGVRIAIQELKLDRTRSSTHYKSLFPRYRFSFVEKPVLPRNIFNDIQLHRSFDLGFRKEGSTTVLRIVAKHYTHVRLWSCIWITDMECIYLTLKDLFSNSVIGLCLGYLLSMPIIPKKKISKMWVENQSVKRIGCLVYVK